MHRNSASRLVPTYHNHIAHICFRPLPKPPASRTNRLMYLSTRNTQSQQTISRYHNSRGRANMASKDAIHLSCDSNWHSSKFIRNEFASAQNGQRKQFNEPPEVIARLYTTVQSNLSPEYRRELNGLVELKELSILRFWLECRLAR